MGALVMATPALAQNYGDPEMTYEERGYEYAQPAPAPQPQTAPITYRQEAVVQPLPPRQTYAQPTRYVKDRVAPKAGADYEVEYEYETAKRVTHAPRYHTTPQIGAAPVTHHKPVHAMPHHGVTYPAPHHQQPAFDQEAWLDECVNRVTGGRHGRRGGNGGVVGGLVGAAAGGLIGNRVAGRGDRLAGTLIGAGVGGLAGLAVGSAADRSSKRKSGDAYAYCEDWLARYSGGGHYGYGYQHHGYAYQYAQPMMLVPVWIQVPQRAVTREYVTTETVDVEVVTYEETPVVRKRVIEYAPAPKPVKRTYIKQAQPTRYVKGK